MKLVAAELRRVELPLAAPFRSSLGVQTVRRVLLVRVETTAGEGWGECSALDAPLYSPEYVEGAEHVVRHHLLPRLFAAGDRLSAAGVAPALAAVKGHPMAKAALEMAVLDAELRARGEPLAARLGGVRRTVEAGVALGVSPSVDALLDAIARLHGDGYRRFKLKIEPGWDVEPVRAARERFGDDVALQVDANGSYSLADTRHLARLDPFDLLLIEQPLAADDLLGHAQLARSLRTPVCLDESVTSARVASTALALGACSVVCVKAGRVGGYLEAVRVHDVCAAAGVPVWCGGMLDTGIARAANLALAALPGFTLPGDLSASGRWFATDVTPPVTLEDGQLPVPDGPGLGVPVLTDAVDALTVERVVVRAS